MWPWAQPPQVTTLRCHLLFTPKLLERILMLWLHLRTPTGPTLNQLLSSAPLLYLNLLCQSLGPCFIQYVDYFLVLTLLDSWLTLHWHPQNNVSLRCLWVVASPPSFHQFYGSSSSPHFSLLLLCSSLGDESLSELSSLALYPNVPERFHQHLGFDYYQLHSADCWRGPLMFLLASVSNIFCLAPADFLVTVSAFPLRTFSCRLSAWVG